MDRFSWILIYSAKPPEIFDPAGEFLGGTLFTFSGASESATFNPQEEQMLFSFSGEGDCSYTDFASVSVFFFLLRFVCDGVLKDFSLVPKIIDGKGTIGAQLQPNIKKETKKTKNTFELFKYTNNEFLSLLVKTIQGYKGLITNFSSTAQQLSGPVKIVEIGAQLSQQGGTGILLFAALISINLAVLNSLPLPLLDGGQLAVSYTHLTLPTNREV